MSIKNKIIIVTGGSGLIGKEIVKDINKKGGLAINADINVNTDLINGTLNCDITSKKSIYDSIKLVIDKYSRIDGLVNNAYPRTEDWGNKFEDVNFESWQKNVDMQLNSVFLMSQRVLEQMKKQQSGSIVNISSIYGVVGNDFTIYEGCDMTSPAAYSAIKGGIVNFTRYLAAYFGEYGIRVNSVSPGGVFNNQNPKFVENYSKKSPLKRMAQPEEIAPAVSFLLSDEASFITGHNLMVDGGWTAI